MADSTAKKPAGGLLDRVGGILDGKALFSEGKEAPAGEAEAKKSTGLLKALAESKHCVLCEKAFGLTVKARTCHACDFEVCQDCSISTCTRCHTAKSTTDQQTTQDFELLWQQTQIRLAEIPRLQEELAQLKEQLDEEQRGAAEARAEVAQLRGDLADAHAALEAEKAEAEQQKAAYEQELAEQRARADEERTNLQGKLSELSEQLLTSMIEPVKREG